MTDDSTYKTGYGKPPKDSQFKKGESGNPNGRPKEARNLRTMFDEVMLEEVEYTAKGKKRHRPAMEVILRRLRNRALKDDDLKAMEMAIRLFQQFGISRSEAKPIDELLGDDKAILKEFAERSTSSTKPPIGPKGPEGDK
jgi:hypothetical protein